MRYEDIDDPQNNEANIFFSSWVAVVDVILLITNWFNASVVTQDYILLASCTLSLLATSLRILLHNNQDELSSETGAYEIVRVYFGVISGGKLLLDGRERLRRLTFHHRVPTILVFECFFIFHPGICAALSLLMSSVRNISPWIHFLVALSFTLLWGFAVVVISITGEQSAATGSVFLAVWINIFLSLDLATMHFVFILRGCQDRNHDKGHQSGDEPDPDLGPSCIVHNENAAVEDRETRCVVTTYDGLDVSCTSDQLEMHQCRKPA